MMNIQYLFASPAGDIPIDSETLERPFLITRTQAHPFLTLGDYFTSIRDFILKDPSEPLKTILKEHLLQETDLHSIRGILIRSEKHGALYHPASIEILTEERPIKLTVSTAVTETGRKWMAREYDILKSLSNSHNLPYLPKVYSFGHVTPQTKDHPHATLTLLLAEWFENYHEWHHSFDENSQTLKICIWDIKHGNRYASEQEAAAIIRQAAKILTLYYDPNSFKQIYPWHHAAGDFIVGTDKGSVDVKLTTARQYESIMGAFSAGTNNPIIAIVYFFLNLTVKMRIDKLDGLGESVWAGSFAVHATTAGFLEALTAMATEGRYDLGQVEELLTLLQSFDEKELGGLYEPLLDLYQEEDPEDLALIQKNLGGHINLLYQTLRNFHLSSLPSAS